MPGLVLLLMLFSICSGVCISASQASNDTDEKVVSGGLAAPPQVQINGSIATVPANMNVHMSVIEGQVMVPLSWASSQLGATSVSWDAAARTATIVNPQDFYSIEKISSYARALQIPIDEGNDRIWPLPGKAQNLKLPELVSNRQLVLELKHFNPEMISTFLNKCLTKNSTNKPNKEIFH